MPNGTQVIQPSEKMSKGFFAALLGACKSACECTTCKILRKISDDVQAEFMEVR